MNYEYTIEEVTKQLNNLSNDPEHIKSVAAITPGRFRRDSANEIYQLRGVYTNRLRKFVYNPVLLEVIFGNSELKNLFFRTFGYRGQTNFTIYPYCWIRDLALLDIGERVYLGDGIVLGTNQVSTDQDFLTVDRITIGARTIFDQQCMVGYGAQIANDCIIGVRVAIGMKTSIGEGSIIRPNASVSHHCKLGNNVKVGINTLIGEFSIIEDGVEIADCSYIPPFSRVTREGIFSRRGKKDLGIPRAITQDATTPFLSESLREIPIQM